MEQKKSREADLESKRIGFIFLGGVIAGAIVLMAFTYKSVKIDPIAKIQEEKKVLKEEILEEFIQNEPPPPPPPQEAPPPVITEVEEVEDDIIIEAPTIIDEDLVDFDFEPEKEKEVKKSVIFDVVSVNPEFPGGDAEMANFINEEFDYPEIAREMGEQGTIYVQFVVNEDGSIEQAEVIKGVSDALDKEALRVVREMPKWKPGEQAGKAVRVRYTIPIRARLG